jgi:hypothetical protein
MINTIHVYIVIIKLICTPAKQARKTRQSHGFLPVSKASTNKLINFPAMYVYCIFISRLNIGALVAQ